MWGLFKFSPFYLYFNTFEYKTKIMKQLINLMSLSCLLLIAGCNGNKTESVEAAKTISEGVVDIKDVRKTQAPDADIAHHKYHDVEVCREISKGDTHTPAQDEYTVYFYSNFNDSLFRYQASDEATEDFDKAAYKWLDDTSASIRLFNSGTKKEVNFKVWGKAVGKNKTEGVTF